MALSVAEAHVTRACAPDPERSCPLCGGAPRLCFEAKGYPVCDCARCGHRFAGVELGDDYAEAMYGDDYFRGGGAGYADYLAEGAILRAHGRRYGSLLSRHAETGRVLDVGAAAGFVLQGLADAGWRGRGVEINPAMALHAREVLGLDVAAGRFEDLRIEHPSDAITMVQVIAHFVDPHVAIEKARDALRPGGLLLIEAWDRASWAARLFRSCWHEYNPPTVLHWFSRDGLAALVERCGFRETARGRPVKRIDGAHLKSALRHAVGSTWIGRAASFATKVIPDRLCVPYLADDVFWMLFRKDR